MFQTYDDSSEDKVQVLTELEKFMGKLRSSIETYSWIIFIESWANQISGMLLDEVVGIISDLNEKGRKVKSEDFKVQKTMNYMMTKNELDGY